MPDAQGASIEGEAVVIRLVGLQVEVGQDFQGGLDVDDTPLLAWRKLQNSNGDGLGLQKVDGQAVVIGQGGITVEGVFLSGSQGISVIGVLEAHLRDGLDAVRPRHQTDRRVPIGAVVKDRRVILDHVDARSQVVAQTPIVRHDIPAVGAGTAPD